MKGIEIIVHGKVQGVFFRKYTAEKASELKLSGWVQNEENGTVRIQVEGDNTSLQQFIDWCHKGAPLAEVEKVEYREISVQNFTNFEIRY